MAPTNGERPGTITPRIFIGGVGQLYQGDLDAGRILIERLQALPLGPEVITDDLYYGAIAVCQRLQELRPSTLVLAGAAARGRPAGTVSRIEVGQLARQPQELGQAVAEAATGYVSIDLILEVACALHALPARTVVIEIEPATSAPGEALSSEAERGVEKALDLIREEIGLTVTR